MLQPSFPVWLNADILAGPVKAPAVPVDPSRFLSKAKEQYPELMLSLGWTTRWGKGLDGEQVPISQGRYSDSAVNDMIHAINNNNITQPITYAVRAAFVAQSLDVLKNLLNKTHDDMGMCQRLIALTWGSRLNYLALSSSLPHPFTPLFRSHS